MIVFAHRGWHGAGTPENSLIAFRRAAAAGFGIETDLRTDRDGHIVLFHDRTVGGEAVDRLARDEIERRAGRAICDLNTLLAEQLPVPLNLEVKTPAAWTALAPYLSSLPAGVLISSFNHAIASAAASTGLSAAYLVASAPLPDRLPVVQLRLTRIVWDFNIVSAPLLAIASAQGLTSVSYGALTVAEHRWLAAHGCEAVITDTPDLAAQALATPAS